MRVIYLSKFKLKKKYMNPYVANRTQRSTDHDTCLDDFNVFLFYYIRRSYHCIWLEYFFYYN